MVINSEHNLYQILRAEHKQIVIEPLYAHFQRIISRVGSEETRAKIVAKQLIVHAATYTTLVNPDSTAKPVNDESMYLVAGLQRLLSDIKTSDNHKDYERSLFKPSEIEKIEENPSISMYWQNLKKILTENPSHKVSNDWFYGLGNDLINAVLTTQRIPRGRVEISPLSERKFNNEASFNLRTDMRRLDRVLEDYANK